MCHQIQESFFESLSVAAHVLEMIYYHCRSGITELLSLHTCTHAYMQGILECSAALVQSTAVMLLCQIPGLWVLGSCQCGTLV